MTNDATRSAWNAIGVDSSVPEDAIGSDSAIGVASAVSNLSVERREAERRPLALNACLVPLGSEDDINCMTDDVGELGMHVTVPVGYGIAVGQRYGLMLAGEGSTIGMGPLLTTEGIYATVVRTDLQGDKGQIGVGLRFDQPLLF